MFIYLPPPNSHPHLTQDTGSISSKKLTGLFKGLLFSPVTHILDSTGNGDTQIVTIWIRLLSAQRNWKRLHNDQTHPTSKAWLLCHQLEEISPLPPSSHPQPTLMLLPKELLAPATQKNRNFPPLKLGLIMHLKFRSGRTVGGSSEPREVGGQVSCRKPKSDFN